MQIWQRQFCRDHPILLNVDDDHDDNTDLGNDVNSDADGYQNDEGLHASPPSGRRGRKRRKQVQIYKQGRTSRVPDGQDFWSQFGTFIKSSKEKWGSNMREGGWVM